MCNNDNHSSIHCEIRNYYYRECYKFRAVLKIVISINNNNLVIDKMNKIEIITLSGQKSNLKINGLNPQYIY